MTQPHPLPILAWQSIPDCARLLDAFLAGRSPRTLAAYRADLEDFRCYKGTSTAADAAWRLLANPQDIASMLVSLYKWEMIRRALQPATINRRLATCGHWSNSPTRRAS
jgi:site-specific recombinase XerD